MATKYTIIICLTASMGMCAFSFAAVAGECPAADFCLAPIRQAEQKDRAEASISSRSGRQAF